MLSQVKMSNSSLNYVFHPHHVSLVSQPHTFQAFYNFFADRVNSVHDYDRLTSQGNFFAPLFNVIETETSYVLDGEVPGIGDKKSIYVAWLPNQVLVIGGVVASLKTGEATDALDIDNEWTKTKGRLSSQNPFRFRFGHDRHT